jgi:hypothetical protein
VNLKTKIFGGVGTAAIVVAAALAVGASTHARAADVAPGEAILFTGTASSVPCTSSGPIPAEPSCTSAGIPYVGGSGTYSFATGTFLPVGCEAADLDSASPVSACTISSSGTYTNVVCGTGLAQGSATVSAATETIDVNDYTIAFAGGLGVIESTAVSDSDGDATAAAGLVDISPVGSGGTAYCTSGFNVIGAAVAA